MSDTLYALALNQYQQLDASVKVVVVHPNYRQQHQLLAQLTGPEDVFYVRCNSHAKATKEELFESVQFALEQQRFDDSPRPCALILDEFDRAKPKVVDAFLKELLATIGDCRVILFGREIPKIILTNKNIRNHTRIIPSDPSIMLWDYTRYDAPEPLLEVRALGTGQVLINGKNIDNWDGILPRSLFFYLIDRGMATRADIFATFWPTLTVREATNVFHVTKRKINEVLDMDLTVYWSGFYRVTPEINLQYDVVNFSQKIQDADIAEPQEAEALYLEALSLAKGDFLIGTNLPWVVKRREELRQTMTDLLFGLAQVYEKMGKHNAALSNYLRAGAMNRQREDIAASTMRMYDVLGNPEDGLKTYEALVAELRQKLRVKPAHEIQQLAEILRNKSRV